MKVLRIYLIISILLITRQAYSQYIQFSQYYASPLNLAPSFAGTVSHSRVAVNYRDQWGKLPGVFRTYSAAADMNVKKINSGFGLLLAKDIAGTGNLGRFDAGVIYSWYGLLNKTAQLYFRPGVAFKLSQRNLDFQKLLFPDQITPYGHLPTTSQPLPKDVKKTYMDASASVMFYNPSFWVGLNLEHLFHPADAYYDPNYRVPYKYHFFAGYKFRLGPSGHIRRYNTSQIKDLFFISTYLRMQSLQAQMDIGGYWNHDPLTFGIWVRGLPYLNIEHTYNVDAIIFLVGYKIYSFEVGYSYDMTVSPLIATTGGSHEITLIYKFDPNFNPRKKEGPIPCPGF